MPYIGSDPSNRFVAPKAATQFSGDGSTTAFTLDHAVGSDEDILVSVDGVIQEPSVAYAVSNGTTLTFTAAPSSNSGNNIFVYYLFRTVGTVSHPSNNALQATTGTFSDDVTIPDKIIHSGDTDTTIRFPAANTVSFETAGSERLRINDDGNILVGRTTELNDFGDGITSLVLQGSGSQDYSTIQLANNGTNSNNQILGLVAFYDGTNENARIQAQRGDGTDVGDLIFSTRKSSGSLTEAMRVYRDGNVGINSTEPNFKLQVRSDNTGSQGVTDLRANSSSFTGNILLVGSNTNTTNSTYNHMRADIHGVAQKFAIRDSGNVVNAGNQYGSLSDERLKENIVDANSQWDDIKALKIRRYNRIGEEQKEIGVIAQELEASNMSGLVEDGEYFDVKNNPDEETRKTVKYSILYMKAVKALQEAMIRIETLEAKVAALESK